MFSYFQVLCVSLVAVTITLANIDEQGDTQGDEGIGGPVNYEFGYNVNDPNSEDVKSHHEIREGRNVYGFYTFKEADGTVRVVKYKVGPTTGFEATVEKLMPGQKIVITKPGDGQDPQSGQGSGYVEENALNEVDGQVVPQYVGGGSRSQYVLGIINNPIRDAPVQNVGQGQVYEQAPAPVAGYGQRQNSARGGRRGNQYAAPIPSRRGHDYGHRQVHGYRQLQAYVQPQPVYNHPYPAPASRVRNSRRRSNGYVNEQEQRATLHNIRNNGGGGQGRAVQDYAVREEENVDQGNNAVATDESEQEAADKEQFEKDYTAALEDDEDDDHVEEEESEHLEEEEAEEEFVEKETENKEETA